MNLFSQKNIIILSETSFLLALSVPMFKIHLVHAINNINLVYGILYILIISGIKHLFARKKYYKEYLAGGLVFMFFALYTTMLGLHLSPSILLMIIICFGKPFWYFDRISIITYIIITSLLLVISVAAKDNIIQLLGKVLLSGQNYLSALIFSVVYLLFFINRKRFDLQGPLYAGLGSGLLFLLRSRTSFIALLPIFFFYFKRFNTVVKFAVTLSLVFFITYFNVLEALFFKYNESDLWAGFRATRGDLWWDSFEYLLINFWSPLNYATADLEVRRLLLGATSAHNWVLENLLMFSVLAIVPITYTGVALIRNFALFLPLLIFALLEPSIFYVANITSFIFLNYLISQRKLK